MTRLIAKKEGLFIIEFDTGSFDDWCVFITEPGKLKYAPKDIDYFSFLHQLGNIHGHAKIYNNFIQIYEQTGKNINPSVLSLINLISLTYGADANETEKWFTVVYAGMIAEENKQYTKLKKRIKRLGLHQLLLENLAPEAAADFSKNKKWQELDRLMKSKGF